MRYRGPYGSLVLDLVIEAVAAAKTRMHIRATCRAARALPQATRLTRGTDVALAQRVLCAWMVLHCHGYVRERTLLMGPKRRVRSDDTPLVRFG